MNTNTLDEQIERIKYLCDDIVNKINVINSSLKKDIEIINIILETK